MRFEVFGPYEIRVANIIGKADLSRLRECLVTDKDLWRLLSGAGCYVFAIKSSGGKIPRPWYVGRAEYQSVWSEATNSSHLQLYNEILSKFERGIPVLYFLPVTTKTGQPKIAKSSSRGLPSVRFLEDWLISIALKANSKLWNIRGTKLLREMYVRGIFNPKSGDTTNSSKSLKSCLKM